jgi:hypothetical protein
MMRVVAPVKQLDEGTNKGQWRKVYEADRGAPDAGSAPYSALDLDRITSPCPKTGLRFAANRPASGIDRASA